jgi:hypothetical protein
MDVSIAISTSTTSSSSSPNSHSPVSILTSPTGSNGGAHHLKESLHQKSTNSAISILSWTSDDETLEIIPSVTVSPFQKLSKQRQRLAQKRSYLTDRIARAAANASLYYSQTPASPRSRVVRQQFPSSNPKNSYIYTGPIDSATLLPDGIGEIIFADGQIYRGSVLQGIRSGYGENNWPGSPTQIYRGAWDKDRRHGKGTHEWVDVAGNLRGRHVTGNWHRGHLQGRICMLWPDGTSYDGDAVVGIKEGRGIQTWPMDGKVYSGQYHNGLEEGQGTLTDSVKHKTYRGQFKQGKRSGKGVQTWKNKVYDGEWLNNVPSGLGKLIWKNGSSYTGHFLNGKFHGHGCYRDARDFHKYIGYWRNGRKHDTGKEYSYGNIYTGGFLEGRRSGYGRMTYVDGSLYTGGWDNGRKNGRGIHLDHDGNVLHCGVWLRGRSVLEQPVVKGSSPKKNQPIRDSSSRDDLELNISTHCIVRSGDSSGNKEQLIGKSASFQEDIVCLSQTSMIEKDHSYTICSAY